MRTFTPAELALIGAILFMLLLPTVLIRPKKSAR